MSLVTIKKDIYYLNVAELASICDYLGIDYNYYIEKDGKLVRGPVDKKIRIVRNILRVLTGTKPKLTVIPETVVDYEALVEPRASSKIFYGQYVNGNKSILELMKRLTNDKFRFGVIAQDILFANWLKGKTLSFRQLSQLWLKYPKKKHPEWKYIDYIRKTGSTSGWSQHRQKIAKKTIRLIKTYRRKHRSK